MMKRLWLAGPLVFILAALLFAGCAATNGAGIPAGSPAVTEPTPKPPEQAPVSVVETVPVKVYFGTHDAQYVVAETHKIKKDNLLMQRAMEILAAGPKNQGLQAVVPPGTTVKSVTVKDRTAYVDFSGEMIKRGFGGSSMEMLTVGSIVNTLTEFPDVERVQILVEGKKVTSLFGHLDVSDPLSRSPGIIKGNKN